MSKYRQRAVIEAEQLTKEVIDAHIFDKAQLPFGLCAIYHPGDYTISYFRISWNAGNAGRVVAQEGDWIIKGADGRLTVCAPEAFAATYEPV